jgi:enterochelin esterase-like enzyme
VPFTAPRAEQAKNTSLFEEHLLKDVIPTVESKYRVAAGRQNRAIAGLSMGGGQSLTIGFNHLDLFSAAVPGDFETRYAQAMADSKGTKAKLKVFWIGCGEQDSLFARSQKLSEFLKTHEIKHTFRATQGAHTYTVWRQYLGELAPLLFR